MRNRIVVTKPRRLNRNVSDEKIVLESRVVNDQITAEISKMFDYKFSGETSLEITIPQIPHDFGIGLLVGSSGSGKSTILNKIGSPEIVHWDNELSVASHFKNANIAKNRLSGVGFNSIPSWLKPYNVLSTGEKFRADIARMIKNNAVIDEFTSVVDRTVAKSCSYAVKRFIDKEKIRNVTFASCHYDIIDWLQPDWIYDVSTKEFINRRLLRPPLRTIELRPCNKSEWALFSHHHYLSGNVNNSARCWLAIWENKVIGFAAAITFPSGNWKNGWRGHRTVVLPDYQGLGFGVRISDAIGEIFISEGCRYFSKTTHPKMGDYRNKSPLWRATSKNMKSRSDYKSGRVTKESKYKLQHANRVAYSHEYMGKIKHG